MTKYFSVDISNDIHIINLCETLEQARETCLAGAVEAHEFADDMDEYENYEINDLPYAVYGVVLGKAKCKKKTLTEEEKDERCSDFDYVLEKPEIVDYPKDDNWIKYDSCPPSEDGFFIAYCPEYDIPVKVAFYDADLCGFTEFTDDEVTHWQPLPQPPEDK